MVTVRCEKCGAQYETELPAAGVQRVRRCAECHRTGLEIISDDDEEPSPAGERPAAESETG
jgi:Zn finger protein HypA/HybF involved in hydrogenase expression